MTTQNPWLEFLEEDDAGRKAAYFSRGNQFAGSGGKRQQSFYQNSFTDIYNQYLGTLGTQVRGGLMPGGSYYRPPGGNAPEIPPPGGWPIPMNPPRAIGGLDQLYKPKPGGLMPTGSWNDYLGGFNFNDWYKQQTTAEQRNPQAGGLVPQARWDVLGR